MDRRAKARRPVSSTLACKGSNKKNTFVILPNGEKAVIEAEKLQGYLLSSSHPVERFKAEFFRSIGFASDNWQVLEAEIQALLGSDARIRDKTEYGQKYEIRGTISGPIG